MRSTRRDFLRYSSTAAAGFAIALSQSKLFAAQQTTLVPLLSVGYAAPGSMQLSNASRILSSDPTFISRDARVTICGGARADKYQKTAGGVAVDAIYPPGPVLFWSAAKNCTTRGNSVVMEVPSTGGLSFSVKNLAAKTESIVMLGLASKADPKLQRGVYVIAIRESSADAAPDWNRLSLARQGGRLAIAGLAVDHAILSIDYAG